MHGKISIALFTALLLIALLGCSTKNVGDISSPSLSASSFSLNVLDDSYVDGGSAKAFTLAVTDLDDHVLVDVKATQAEGLKALYFDLTYDASTYRPMTAEPSDTMGSKSDLLRLAFFKDTGKVHYGQIVANPSWHAGMSGDGVVAQVLFKKEPAPVMRVVSKVSTDNSAKTTLNWDGGTNTLSWLYYNKADYDQNGEVNISDLTPIGMHYGETVDNSWDDPLRHVDGDHNGEINVASEVGKGTTFTIVLPMNLNEMGNP